MTNKELHAKVKEAYRLVQEIDAEFSERKKTDEDSYHTSRMQESIDNVIIGLEELGAVCAWDAKLEE